MPVHLKLDGSNILFGVGYTIISSPFVGRISNLLGILQTPNILTLSQLWEVKHGRRTGSFSFIFWPFLLFFFTIICSLFRAFFPFTISVIFYSNSLALSIDRTSYLEIRIFLHISFLWLRQEACLTERFDFAFLFLNTLLLLAWLFHFIQLKDTWIAFPFLSRICWIIFYLKKCLLRLGWARRGSLDLQPSSCS